MRKSEQEARASALNPIPPSLPALLTLSPATPPAINKTMCSVVVYGAITNKPQGVNPLTLSLAVNHDKNSFYERP